MIASAETLKLNKNEFCINGGAWLNIETYVTLICWNDYLIPSSYLTINLSSASVKKTLNLCYVVYGITL